MNPRREIAAADELLPGKATAMQRRLVTPRSVHRLHLRSDCC